MTTEDSSCIYNYCVRRWQKAGAKWIEDQKAGAKRREGQKASAGRREGQKAGNDVIYSCSNVKVILNYSKNPSVNLVSCLNTLVFAKLKTHRCTKKSSNGGRHLESVQRCCSLNVKSAHWLRSPSCVHVTSRAPSRWMYMRNDVTYCLKYVETIYGSFGY